MLLSALAWATGSWWQGRDAMSTSRAGLIRAAFVLIGTGCVLASVASLPSGPALLMYPAWLIAGLGAGLGMSSIGVLLLDWTNDADRGRDSAALQLGDGVLSAVTTGAGGALVAAAAHGLIGYTSAFVSIDLAMAALAAVGVIAAGQARRPRPDRRGWPSTSGGLSLRSDPAGRFCRSPGLLSGNLR